MPRKNSRGPRKKKRTHTEDDPDAVKAAKSFIICRGKVAPVVKALCSDWNETFLPTTSKKLKLPKNDTVKHISRMGKMLGVGHVQVFTSTTMGTNLRIARLPHGPTLCFRVESFERIKDVKKAQRRPHVDRYAYLQAALPILSNFATSADPHVKMVQTLLTSLFPPLRVDTVRLTECKRVCLFHLHPDTGLIDVRHYLIVCHRATHNKGVKRLEKRRLSSRLGSLNDVAEVVTNRDAFASDSDREATEVVLPQRFRGLEPQAQGMLRLVEMGPRLTLSLTKILGGMLDGEVIYHSHVSLTAADAEEIRRRRKKRLLEKRERRETQSKRVEEKKIRMEEKKRRRLHRQEAGGGSDTEDEGSSGPASLEEDEGSPDEAPPAKAPRLDRMPAVLPSEAAAEPAHGFQAPDVAFPRAARGARAPAAGGPADATAPQPAYLRRREKRKEVRRQREMGW